MRWTRRVFGIAAAAWWVYLVLDLLTLKVDVFNRIAAALSVKIGIKGFGLSLGSLLASICVLGAGYLLALAESDSLSARSFSRACACPAACRR